MAKNIILCSAGTGNRGGKLFGTNIWRLFKAVDLHGHKSDPTKTAQVTFYDDGVGTENFKLFIPSPSTMSDRPFTPVMWNETDKVDLNF